MIVLCVMIFIVAMENEEMIDLIDRQEALDALHGFFDGMLETIKVTWMSEYCMFGNTIVIEEEKDGE